MINNRSHERTNRPPRRKPTLKNRFNKNGIKMESDRPQRIFRVAESDE